MATPLVYSVQFEFLFLFLDVYLKFYKYSKLLCSVNALLV